MTRQDGKPLMERGREDLNDLTNALRRLVVEVATSDPDEATSRELTAMAEAMRSYIASATSSTTAKSHPWNLYLARNPVSGAMNPIAPPVVHYSVETMGASTTELRGTVNFSSAFEGPPRWVHGGMVAAALDDALGLANGLAGKAGLTVTLTVRYHKPTPLRTDLDIEARCLDGDGRKVTSWAGIYCAGDLLAEAEGLFILATGRQ
jgi:acyl-coenzyme A thioesterase PaaI-like protein